MKPTKHTGTKSFQGYVTDALYTEMRIMAVRRGLTLHEVAQQAVERWVQDSREALAPMPAFMDEAQTAGAQVAQAFNAESTVAKLVPAKPPVDVTNASHEDIEEILLAVGIRPDGYLLDGTLDVATPAVVASEQPVEH